MKRLLSWLAIATEKFTTLISWRITLPLTALLFVTQCAKELPDNPVPSGTHYFNCVLNGQEWVASVPLNANGPAALQAEYIPSLEGMTLQAVKKTQGGSIYEKIVVSVHGVQGVGTYSLFTEGGDIEGFYDIADNYDCGPYYHNPNSPGQLTITTFDTVQRLIKGTFHVVLKNSGCGSDSLMTLSDGKFAFRY